MAKKLISKVIDKFSFCFKKLNSEKVAFNKNRDQALNKIQLIRVRIWHNDSHVTSLALTET